MFGTHNSSLHFNCSAPRVACTALEISEPLRLVVFPDTGSQLWKVGGMPKVSLEGWSPPRVPGGLVPTLPLLIKQAKDEGPYLKEHCSGQPPKPTSS